MTKKNIALCFATFFLIIIFTPIWGKIYESIFGPVTSGFFWVSSGANFEGFFISYMLFISLLVLVFGGAKKYKTWLILLSIVVLFNIILGAWEDLIINIGATLVGWLLAQATLLLKKYIFIKKQSNN